MKYLVGLVICSVLLLADEYVVIANKNFKHLSALEIKAVFLKKIKYIEDQSVVPVNLEANDPVRQKFQKKFLHMGMKQLQNYWTQQHYLGNRPPLNMKSQESVKAFVQKVAGAIGYIQSDQLDDTVTVIATFRDEEQ